MAASVGRVARGAGTPVVEVRGLTKRFGAVTAVDALDLTIAPGEVFGFLGPNGAGKTTVLRLLLDLLRPDAGTLEVLGLDPRHDGVALRAQVGYLPSELFVDPRRSGLALLTSGARLRGSRARPADRTVAHGHQLAERLGLDLQRRCGELSTGNRRKLGIVLALAHEPRLVVLDEPTSGLDPLVQQEFAALVQEATTAGGSVVLCSHVLPEVQRLAQRVGVLRLGRLVHSGSIAALRAQARREVTVDLADPADAARVAAALRDPVVTGDVVRGTVSGPPGELLAALAGLAVDSLLITEPDLEKAFLHLYSGDPA